ncbi:MAG: hypothetical protein GF401_01095 [Chitinivibrionales bacterium]|nr:hypothetical protein [Chitinivibrionales bacterium]
MRIFAFIAFQVLLLEGSSYAAGIAKALGRHEFYLEINDPYYASCGLYFAFADSGIPQLTVQNESEIYGYFLKNVHKPNAFLVEIGIYPAQLIGAGIKYARPKTYDNASVADINFVEALTTSINFPEPWSMSLFLGHVGRFGGADNSFEGRGNIGLLVSYGNYHIKSNSIYPDHWGEIELKLKIDKGGIGRRYAMSYRVGARLHAHDEIKSLFYIGLRRDRTDFKEEQFSLIKNTNFEIRTDFALDTLQFQKLACEIGKKYPFILKKHKLAIGLSVGFSWLAANPYHRKLGEGFTDNEPAPILRFLFAF